MTQVDQSTSSICSAVRNVVYCAALLPVCQTLCYNGHRLWLSTAFKFSLRAKLSMQVKWVVSCSVTLAVGRLHEVMCTPDNTECDLTTNC